MLPLGAILLLGELDFGEAAALSEAQLVGPKADELKHLCELIEIDPEATTRALTIMPLISEWMLWSGVRPVEKVRVRSAVRRRPLPPERSSDVLERHARLVEKGAAFASASSVWVVVGNHPCGSFVVVVERTPRTARRGVAETPRRGRGSRERRPRVASRDDSRKKRGGRLRSPAVTPPVGRARRRGACAGPRATMR